MKTKIIAILLFASSFIFANEETTIEIQKDISESISASISQKGRLTIASVGGNASIKYDPLGRPASIGDARIKYDPLGRPASIGDARIKYDPLGRLASVGDARITYDPLGRPASVVGDLPKGYGIRMMFPEP